MDQKVVKILKKVTNWGFFSLFASSVVWFASLAARHYCGWGVEGFTGYTCLSYAFLVTCHGFISAHGFTTAALNETTDDNFTENLES